MAGLTSVGFSGSQPHFIEVTTSGDLVFSRQVGNDGGEMFSSLIEDNGDIYLGGMGGGLGSEKKYIVKYNAAMTQVFAKDFGTGQIRYLVSDGGNIAAAGFSRSGNSAGKPCIIKLDASGNIIWYKEYAIGGANADAYSIHEHNGNYYMVGNTSGGDSYLLSVKSSDGSVNWAKTYSASSAPHFTGMAISSTGIIACGVTSSMANGNLIVAKFDFNGDIIWTKQINDAYSWYNPNIGSGYSWGINCAIDQYGDVVVAYEDNTSNNHGGLLAKMVESSGTLKWIKKYKTSNGDGFHGITIFGCTYLASGWFHSTGYNYGLVVSDQEGFIGSGANPTDVTRTTSSPTITATDKTASTTVSALTTSTNYNKAVNTNANSGFSKVVKQSGTSTICEILEPEQPDSCDIGTITGDNKVCVGSTVTLSVGGDASGTWEINNSNATFQSAGSGKIDLTGVTAGSVTVKYKLSDTCTTTFQVEINALPTVTIDETNGTVCQGLCDGKLTAVTQNTPPYTYEWKNSSDNIVGGNTADLTNLCEDTYTVKVKDGNGCEASATGQVIETTSANADFTFDEFCEGATNGPILTGTSGGTYSFSPQPADGATIDPSTGVITNGKGGTTYTVKYETTGNCSATSTVNVKVNALPVITIDESNAIICQGSCDGKLTAVVQGGLTPYTYEWKDATNNTVGGNSEELIDLCAGNYSLHVVDANSCEATKSGLVKESSPSDANFTFPSFCEGSPNAPVLAGASGGTFSFVPQPNDGATINSSTGVISNGKGGTTYTVKYETSGNCSVSSTVNVTVYNNPIADFSINPIDDKNPLDVTVVNNSIGGNDYFWDFLNNGDETKNNADSITYTYDFEGTYTIILTATTSQGCKDTASAKVTVVLPKMTYQFPNVFSPNNDGSNEEYHLIQFQNIKEFDVIIVNRWGIKVFESDDENFKWNGKVNNDGEECLDGVYFYTAKIKSHSGEVRKENGFIHLVR